MTPDAIVALLADLLLEVKALRVDLARHNAGRGARDQADRDLIPAIARAVGSRAFTSKDLLAHARVDRALAEAIENTDATTVREVGKLLSRLSRDTYDSFMLAKVDAGRDGAIWQVATVRQ